MRRNILVLVMLVVMVAMLATPAFAAKPKFECTKGKRTISPVGEVRKDNLEANKGFECKRIR